MCNRTDKIAHRSLRAAAQAVLEQRALGRTQRAYWCRPCSAFHLTSDAQPLTDEQLAALEEAAR